MNKNNLNMKEGDIPVFFYEYDSDFTVKNDTTYVVKGFSKTGKKTLQHLFGFNVPLVIYVSNHKNYSDILDYATEKILNCYENPVVLLILVPAGFGPSIADEIDSTFGDVSAVCPKEGKYVCNIVITKILQEETKVFKYYSIKNFQTEKTPAKQRGIQQNPNLN